MANATSGLFLLGLLCGATALIALYSLIIGSAYRATGLWWLAATLVVGMLPVLAEFNELLTGRVVAFHWGRPTAWAVLALSCWLLREVLGRAGSQRVPALFLTGVALICAAAAAAGVFVPLLGLSLFVGPLWLLATSLALRVGWVRFAPWIYWIAGGQLALAVGWIGLMVLQSRGVEPSDMPAILWKAGQLALFGFATYMALVWRSRLRSEVKLRARLVERSDPLTGLALPHIFTRQVDAASARAREFGYRNVLVGLQVSNLDQLANDHGLDNDELALVAAAGAISAALRDVDTAARMGTNRFVVLVEGVAVEESLHDVATRFVASGLRADPVRGLRLMVKFQCVALAVAEQPGSAHDMLAQLAAEPYTTPQAEQGTSIRLVAPVSFSPSAFSPSP